MINITSHSLEAPPHEIPIWALRLEVQGIINRYAEVFECSRDFITAAVYAIVSTICGKHIELFDGKYNNNPNHWICVVAPSGSNKSAPIKALLEPIFKEEKLRIKKFKEEYREYKKNGGEEPVRDRLIVSDVTPEGLYQVLADKDNTKAGLLLYRDEIKGFLDDMNRYNSSGEISNYLSIYEPRSQLTVRHRNLNGFPILSFVYWGAYNLVPLPMPSNPHGQTKALCSVGCMFIHKFFQRRNIRTMCLMKCTKPHGMK